MSELPKGWVATTLGDLGRWSSGGTPSKRKPEYYGGDIPWVRTGDLRDNEIHDVEGRISPEGLANSSAKEYPSGTLLVAMYGATIGRTGMLRIPATTNQACAALLPDPVTDDMMPFLWWFFRHKVEDFRAVGQGGAQPNISQTVIKASAIDLPPLPEQRRIVAKLDRLSARSAAARDHLARTTKLATRAKQAALQAAFQGRLTEKWRSAHPDTETAAALMARTSEPEQSRGGRTATTDVVEGVGGIAVNDPGTPLPEGWAWVSLRRLARQETGHTPSRRHPEWWGGDVPWIGIKDANIHHGRVIHETLQTTNDDGLANSSARLLPAGTVCLSRTASVGYVTMMGRPMATSQDFATWTCSDGLDPEYLMYALMSEGDEIRRFGEGSTHTTIYFPEIRAFHIKLAPLEEQKEIVRKVRTAFTRIDRLTEEASRAAHLLDRLDERLLAKAFRGELVPQDPDDEPAEALLTRIREARAAAPKAKRARRRKAAAE